MNKLQYKRASGLYYSRDEAEDAVRALQQAGYDMNQVSVIARDGDKIAGHENTEKVGNKADDGATAGALTGGTLGGITGLLVGLGALAIPGIGPILLAGAEATAIATTLAGAGIGAVAGGLVGALVGLGIPEEKAKIYSDRVGGGSFLVMVTGTAAKINRAADIMRHHGVEEFEIYDIPAPTRTNTATTATSKDTTTIATAAPTAARRDVNSNSKIDTDRDNIKLYEERLVVNKDRQKAGEVAIGKKVETKTAEVAVPVEKERVVIERRDATETSVVNPNSVNFGNGEVAHMDIYEESADIEKQAFVREEVDIHKEVTQDTVQSNQTIRREELEVDVDGNVTQR
jgi:uncharacterized protein (TIGR02271 family)